MEAARQKALTEKAAADKAAADKKRAQEQKQAADKKSAEDKREREEAAERQRQENIRRMLGQAGASGAPQALSIEQTECFAAAVRFARTEGIVPAPEPTHALAATMREALACKESGEEKVIVTAMCGHGLLDLAAYDAYLNDRMVDSGLSDADLDAALSTIPVMT